MQITITRPHVPTTHLHVVTHSADEKNLGANRPVAFVLPGGPGADHTAYLSYACLEEVTDLVFHDPRGCGLSDKGELSTYTMANYIDDVDAIRSHLGLNKIIVIGKSYGSMCGLGYALKYPERVQKLVLAAGAPSYHFLETAKKNILKLGTPLQIRYCEKLWAGKFKDRQEVMHFFEITNSLYSVKARTNPGAFDLAKKSSQFAYDVLNEGFRQSFWHFDYVQALSTITCPTLILAGREDWINDVKYAELMMKRIPNSQLKIFPNASHAMETDVTDVYFQTIADFIQT